MKIIFSRKGFDSGSGGAPSPIMDRRPVSLPIPTRHRSETTYADLGLADIVETATKGRISGANLCHLDPMFEVGRCAFGQTGVAQSHLKNNGVGVGDIFLFFGLFSDSNGRNQHHRLFGWMMVDEVIALGAHPRADNQPSGFSVRHPHTLGEWNPNNTLYLGEGGTTRSAHEKLRLSRRGDAISRWRIPPWLSEAGLTYHSRADRWEGVDTLNVVALGQEFVSDAGDRMDARLWIEELLSAFRDDMVNA